MVFTRIAGGRLVGSVMMFSFTPALPKKWISLDNKFVFVAERRMNLARSFKAGIEGANSCHVASATIESMFQPSLTRRGLVALAVVPALKGRATFKPPPCGEEKATQDIPRGDFLGKVTQTKVSTLRVVVSDA